MPICFIDQMIKVKDFHITSSSTARSISAVAFGFGKPLFVSRNYARIRRDLVGVVPRTPVSVRSVARHEIH